MTIEEVQNLLSGMLSKSSPLDILPCLLLKSCPSHCQTCQPLTADRKVSCPILYKTAQVLPLLTKARLDSSLSANYRLVSNLSTVSKVLERLVLAHLQPHLLGFANFSQSAYRKCHSTEMVLPSVLDSAFTAADDRQVTVLVSLNLSGPLIQLTRLLLHRLWLEFGVSESPLSWLQSYLEG